MPQKSTPLNIPSFLLEEDETEISHEEEEEEEGADDLQQEDEEIKRKQKTKTKTTKRNGGEQKWRYQNISRVTDARRAVPRSVKSVQSHGNVEKRVRVKPSGPKKPFSNYKKHSKLKVGERPPDPYLTPWEKDIRDQNESRKHWVGDKPFIVTDHKAVVARRERELAGSSCVTASGPYTDPSEYFRDEDKTKFVGPRNFI